MGKEKKFDPFEEISYRDAKPYSIEKRKSKVSYKDFPPIPRRGIEWPHISRLFPDTLQAGQLKEVAKDIARCGKENNEFVFMMGAHSVKTGLNPYIIRLMEDGFITCLATNGATAIHDIEIAFFGETSEDVSEQLPAGDFGMVDETSKLFHKSAKFAFENKISLGKAIGKTIVEEGAKYRGISIFGKAYELGIPFCVHTATGTEIIYQHPDCDGSILGETSLRDFRIFANHIAHLSEGVILNLGSAVIMPEVFLKALSLARHLGNKVENFTAVVIDMIKHYRSFENVVNRPTIKSGKGYYITGPHEILLPLLVYWTIEFYESKT